MAEKPMDRDQVNAVRLFDEIRFRIEDLWTLSLPDAEKRRYLGLIKSLIDHQYLENDGQTRRFDPFKRPEDW